MSQSISFNGVVYTIPDVGDDSWGQNLTDFFTAIPSGCLQKVGGTFTLTADANFGANFGLLTAYFSSRTSTRATAGNLRLANAETIQWRNAANSANKVLKVNASDLLEYDGIAIVTGSISSLTGDVTASGPGAAATTIGALKVTNAMLAGSIAAAKLVGSDIATVGTITTGTWGGTTIALNKGGTGQTTKAAAFDALSPLTTGGDLLYGGASGTGTRLANGSSGQFLKSAGGTSAPIWAPVSSAYTAPTVQKFTSGSGTYTTAANALYIRLRMCGGGGGGAGSGTAAGTVAGDGGNSTFGSSLHTAAGGVHGIWNNGSGGAGGAATIGAGGAGLGVSGGRGSGAGSSLAVLGIQMEGGPGGVNPLGGSAGAGGAGTAGGAGAANTGAGGQGGGSGSNIAAVDAAGDGGGAGAYMDIIIAAPAASYSYVVGAAGTAGVAGANGFSGGAGGSGYIELTEYYQ